MMLLEKVPTSHRFYELSTGISYPEDILYEKDNKIYFTGIWYAYSSFHSDIWYINCQDCTKEVISWLLEHNIPTDPRQMSNRQKVMLKLRWS